MDNPVEEKISKEEQQYKIPRHSHSISIGVFIFSTALVFLLGGVGGFFLGAKKVYAPNPASPSPAAPSGVFCTQEAKLCPDGSYVSRHGPQCEFDACPSQPTSTQSSDLKGWKLYSNTQDGYQAQYPSDSFYKRLCTEEGLLLSYKSRPEDKNIQDETTYGPCGRDGRFDFEVITSTKPTTEFKTDQYYSVVKEPVIIDGVNGYKYTGTLIYKGELGPAPAWYSDIQLAHKGKYYTLHMGRKDIPDLYNQILTTFKFTQ